MSKNLLVQALVGIRAEAGNGFIAALDDIRQKVIEEGWTGRTATPAHDLKTEFSDPMAALYGRLETPAASMTPAERDQTTQAYNQAVAGGAERTVREIETAVPGDVLTWLRGSQAEAGRDPMGRTKPAEAEAPAREPKIQEIEPAELEQ